jgi:hypothetical protein
MLVDLTSPERDTLDTLIAERDANGPTITSSTLQAELLAANASYKSPAVFQSCVVPLTGILSVERQGRYSFVEAHGVAGIATVTSIATVGINPFVDGDRIEIKPRQGAWILMQLPTQPLAVGLIRTGNFASYVLAGGEWSVAESNPEIKRVIAQPLERVSTSTSTLSVMTEAVGVKFITGETPSGGNVEISTSGVSGSVTAYVDRGFGLELLGEYSYTGSPSVTDVATGLAAAINALYLVVHNFQASSAIGVVTVIPQDGLGAIADTYVLSSVDTGDCVSVAAGFGLANGGTDAVAGVEAAGTVNQLETPAIDGTVIEITNEMTSAALTLDKIAGVGNFATGKVLAAKESARVKYNSALGEFTHFV